MSKLNRISVAVLALAVAVPTFAARPETKAGHYYVKFKGGATASDRANVRAAGADIDAEFADLEVVEIKVKNPNAAAALSRNARVEFVEEVPMRYATALADSQAVPSLANGLYGLLTTKSTTAHARGWTGSGVIVGVADTQLDITHPDIAANLLNHSDCVQRNPCSGSGWANDGETHATHVAGTIVGVNNAAGVLGAAYGAKLLHTRVLGPNGGSTSDIMRGVTWMKDRGAKIINLSLGGGVKSRTEENFYKNIRAAGVVVVAATGNDGASRVSYPAAYPVNVAVGAVDVNDVVASFSNRGSAIDVTAPGVMVLSAVPAGTGSEASVTAGGVEHRAFGMEFAPKTTGVSGNIVYCGLGQAGEFPAAVSGNIALIQRGSIDFVTKVNNAKAAGAKAAIIYNNVAGDFTGTLGAAGNYIPAVSVSQAAGTALRSQTSGTVLDQVSSWDHYDGTSMATPHAAGVFALVWGANPTMTANSLETTIKNNCDDKGAAGFDSTYGYGRVNADKALLATGK
jgi:subtilisin family serine protease